VKTASLDGPALTNTKENLLVNKEDVTNLRSGFIPWLPRCLSSGQLSREERRATIGVQAPGTAAGGM